MVHTGEIMIDKLFAEDPKKPELFSTIFSSFLDQKDVCQSGQGWRWKAVKGRVV